MMKTHDQTGRTGTGNLSIADNAGVGQDKATPPRMYAASDQPSNATTPAYRGSAPHRKSIMVRKSGNCEKLRAAYPSRRLMK